MLIVTHMIVSGYLHVFLCVDAAVGCQFVGLRQLSNSLFQAVHLRVHSIYGLNRNDVLTSPASLNIRLSVIILCSTITLPRLFQTTTKIYVSVINIKIYA